jgi:tetratricopeptide (TPR) repeat protein
MRTFVPFLSLCAAVVALFSSAANAQTAAKMPPSQAASAVQIAGIIEKTTDKLWDQTDAYWHEGDYNRIVDLCRIVAEADPDFTESYANAAWLLWSMGDMLAADMFLEYGISRSKNKGELLFDFGHHLYNTKRYAQAEPYLARAITYPRASYSAYSSLGHTYRQLGKFDKSIAVWKQAVKKFPNMGAAKTNLDRV